VVIDEIHLLNDQSRGPTLEVVLTMLRRRLNDAQFIGLSATIGNDEALADWLDAGLVDDDWRPVELREGTYQDGVIHFVNTE
jgi:helicase